MTSGGEMAGVELVCRLMAATPPYLYNPNGPPHCFFFSDLLRSLVAKRCATSPPAEDPVSSKRIRIASIGSAFSAKTGTRVEGHTRAEHHSTNPLSPSCILPRLDLLYRSLHEMERETMDRHKDRQTSPERQTDLRPPEERTEVQPADRQELVPADRRTDVELHYRALDNQPRVPVSVSPYPAVKHEADVSKITQS
uniref:Uncharacterized protein n=2 Tax=Lygus hesperus TaxID=30085 RepID=A0A0A9W3S9_LYGHE